MRDILEAGIHKPSCREVGSHSKVFISIPKRISLLSRATKGRSRGVHYTQPGLPLKLTRAGNRCP
jgi:hypothetical protein